MPHRVAHTTRFPPPNIDADFLAQPAYVPLPHVDEARLQLLGEALEFELALRSLVQAFALWQLQFVEQIGMSIQRATLVVQ